MQTAVKPPAYEVSLAAPAKTTVELPRLLWRQRRTVGIVFAISLAIGWAYTQYATKLYTSSAQLSVEQNAPQILTTTPGGVETTDAFLYQQAQFISSTAILNAVAKRPEIEGLKSLEGINNTILYLKQNLRVDVGRKDRLLTVAIDTPVATDSAVLINAVVDAFVEHVASRQKSASGEVVKILEKQKAQEEADYQGKLDKLLAFKNKNGALSYESNRGNVIIQRLAELSSELTKSQIATSDAEASYNTALAMTKTSMGLQQFVESERLRGALATVDGGAKQISELIELQTKLRVLETQYKPDHPIIRSGKRELEELGAAVAARRTSIAATAIESRRLALNTARAKEFALEALFDSQQAQASDLNKTAVELVKLQADVDRAQKLRDMIDTRITEVGATNDTGALAVDVLEPALPAESASSPSRKRAVIISTMLGLLGGSALALLRGWTDTRLRVAQDVTSYSGLSVLGSLPRLSGPRFDGNANGQLVARRPHSDTAEAYRMLSVTVSLGEGRSDHSKTWLITSLEAGDGKSTCASNLAIAMARTGQRTLLIDADLRRPRQHKTFDIENSRGLCDVLAGTIIDAWAIRETNVPKLHVMPSGCVLAEPGELLALPELRHMLQRLSELYDRIIIDSPPLLAAADARILSAAADRTLFVVRANRTRLPDIHAAQTMLHGLGANVAGVVINDIVTSQGKYRAYAKVS